MNSYYTNREPLQDIRRLLHNQDIVGIADVGAFEGDSALKLSAMFPAAMVYAFEPHPESFAQLRENTKLNPKIVCLNAAVSSETGWHAFHKNRLPYTSSLLSRPSNGRRYYPIEAEHYDSFDVETWALDDWRLRCGGAPLDLLKIDVQGMELHVIKGAKRVIQEMTKIILTEVEFVRLYESATQYNELGSHLNQQGFQLYQLYNLVVADDGQLVYGDAVFINERFREGLSWSDDDLP